MAKKVETHRNTDSIEMWKDTDKQGFKALCEYLPDKHKFKVTVSKDSYKYHQLFRANFEPRFGMDVVDVKESQDLATILAKKIEEDIKNKTS